ncbi:hypothetical protein OG194_33900 [Streptomyces sp. NBC_01288]|uniref:hypothetical protein n=1 Tax=Streptomyces sp. NBC_01288 TaxID=2903814 RepID=UPI002E0F7A71|nr:hypothetical protein OG194_33900 [Streptomyces sp. NBC_01288]
MTVNAGTRRSGDSVVARKKTGKKWMGLATLALAPMVLLASPGVASAASQECLQNSENSSHDMAGNSSTDHQTQSVGVQQANNTWQDWVWRGPTFQCPWNVPSCSYAWQQSKTTGWQYSAGLSIKVPIPVIGNDLASLTPSYNRSGSTTTSYTFTTNLSPGQFAQPIQVVQRRWTQGVYKGIYHSTGAKCTPSPSNPNGKAYEYTWSPDERWGNWTTNLKVSDYGTYNVWK